jgi:hypothetical protein
VTKQQGEILQQDFINSIIDSLAASTTVLLPKKMRESCKTHKDE